MTHDWRYQFSSFLKHYHHCHLNLMCTSHPLMVNSDSGLGVNSPPPASQTQVAWVQTLLDRKHKAPWSGYEWSLNEDKMWDATTSKEWLIEVPLTSGQ